MQWVKDLAAAVAQIQSLAWELPYVTGVALKKKKKEAEAGVPLWHSGLRIQRHCRLQLLLWHRFDLWPRNFCMPWVWPK